MNDQVPADTTEKELDAVLAAAASAAAPFAAIRPADRSAQLVAVADALDAAADELVPLAMEESGLPEPRLRGEVTRTTVQLRMFADVLTEGAHLDARIDRADPDAPLGGRPDLRRVLLPLGPVLVFAASNFPFAFSVAGGDTASALAAGCPVVVKAHPGHPRTSQRTAEVVTKALAAAGAPQGVFALVHGFDTGVTALKDPRVAAAGFTGSVPAGRALFDIAARRETPIPFYGELGSLNPVFVTRAAVDARGEAIAEGYAGSFTLGTGQFCTKPGLLFVPRGHGLTEALTKAAAAVQPSRMLHRGVFDGYSARRTAASGVEGVRTLVGGEEVSLTASPTLLATDVATLLAHRETLLEECFGPLSIVVEYDGRDELLRAAEAFGGNLTATVHAELGAGDDEEALRPLLALLADRAGRIVWNGWPTGVAVTAAMQHGGPYPATTSPLHTSVGTAAITRFLRPVAYQGVPQALLPEALRDDNPLGVPQRVDG